MLIVQITLVITYWNAPQLHDNATYIRFAQNSLSAGWYPQPADIYSAYIFAPGLVNFLILQLKWFHTVGTHMLISIVMNLGIIYMLYRLAIHYFTRRTALISVCLYALMYSTWWIVCSIGTELLFLFLTLLAFCLLHYRRVRLIFLAGVFFALGNWVRPLMFLLIIPGLVMMACQRRPWHHYACLALGIGMTMCTIGAISHHFTGHFITQSTTSGINLAIAYNPQATGTYSGSGIKDPHNPVCHIEHIERYTYAQCDSIWRTRALHYAFTHPIHVLRMALMKLPIQFIGDTWPDKAVLPDKGMRETLMNTSLSSFQKGLYLLCDVGKSAVYYIVCLCMLVGLWKEHKHLLSTRRGIILLILIVGIGLNCLLVASARYHYPYLFAMTLFAARAIELMLVKRLHT